LAAGGDHELIVVKQRRTAFTLDSPLLAVAEQLVDGLMNGFLHLGRLAFYHRQPVEEKQDVWDDVAKKLSLKVTAHSLKIEKNQKDISG
jgi:hypothetical protein